MSHSNSLVDVESLAALRDRFARTDGGGKRKAVLLFGADWHEACPTLRVVLTALAEERPELLFGYVEAENAPDLTDLCDVTVVPTVVLLNGGPEGVLEKLEGVVEPSHVTLAVQRLVHAQDGTAFPAGPPRRVDDASAAPTPGIPDPQEALRDRLDRLVRADDVMLFMKGTPTAPRCGFSRQAVEILTENDVPFGSFDIMGDEDVRQGLKKYSDWPTYPQLVGSPSPVALDEIVWMLLTQEIVQLNRSLHVCPPPRVRACPCSQYVKGELIGGLDILKETAAEGPLKEQWEIEGSAALKETLHDRLTKLVRRHDVMLFMKGLPTAPQCGFSRQIVEILDDSEVPYDAFNILQDDEVRQGLKDFSDWPTYPQLYVKGELIGGLDIVQELKESGELQDVLNGQ